MPGTTSTALPSFSHDQHHETDAAKWKGEITLRQSTAGGGTGSGAYMYRAVLAAFIVFKYFRYFK